MWDRYCNERGLTDVDRKQALIKSFDNHVVLRSALHHSLDEDNILMEIRMAITQESQPELADSDADGCKNMSARPGEHLRAFIDRMDKFGRMLDLCGSKPTNYDDLMKTKIVQTLRKAPGVSTVAMPPLCPNLESQA